MKNSTIRTGLIGCGHLGTIHSKLLRDITLQHNFIEFTGVYDIVNSRSEKIEVEYKTKSFSSLEELLSTIDALIIATPTSTHFEIASKALDKKINLFIEKPVTSTGEEAGKLINKTKDSGVKVQVGHVERFNPALTSLSKYELNPRFIESHRLAQFNPRGTDVSVIQDLMIHDIDIILHLVKSPINKIDASGVAVISNSIDIANARISFENGCAANVTSSRISLKKMRKMRIFQSNAYISIDFLNNKSELFRLASPSEVDKNTMAIELSEDKKLIYEQPGNNMEHNNNPIKEELLSFFESIKNNSPVKVSLSDAKLAIEAADEIIRIISSTSKPGA
jgi:predicted dehydrogenase